MDGGRALAEGRSLFLELCTEWHSGSLHAGLLNPPPEQLLCQGAECWWMPELDVMDLPDAAALHPLICKHMRKLNDRTSPGFDAIAAPFIK
eukprot:scaffold71304_cov16-Tisochrysis_lutea.AAC.2